MHWARICSALLALILFLSLASECIAGIGSLRERWPQGHKITACFFGGTEEARSVIVDAANEWTQTASVKFDFGRGPDYHSCNSATRYDIRVGFSERGSWSVVGTQALGIPQDQPTINFFGQGERVDPSWRKTLLEEFGHVLGILHAEQDPKTNCFAELDLAYFQAQGLDEEGIRKRYFPFSPTARRPIRKMGSWRRSFSSPSSGQPTG